MSLLEKILLLKVLSASQLYLVSISGLIFSLCVQWAFITADYDEKAENAIDYEDIDEEYDGPETQAATEEDHLLPKKEYFAADVSSALEPKASVFDDENYDEDEESEKEQEVVGKHIQVQSVLSGSLLNCSIFLV